jgi:hypothetical protein
MVINKALYSLRSSGLYWHQHFANVLPCKSEADIWICLNNGIYEYVAVYVDDLLIAANDPSYVKNALCDQYQFRIKVQDRSNTTLVLITLRTTLVPFFVLKVNQEND